MAWTRPRAHSTAQKQETYQGVPPSDMAWTRPRAASSCSSLGTLQHIRQVQSHISEVQSCPSSNLKETPSGNRMRGRVHLGV